MQLSGGHNAIKLEVQTMPINNAARLVPMMFRAQIVDRCQLQRIPIDRNKECDALPWAREWTQEVYPHLPITNGEVQEKQYQINWRMFTNSGVDDAIYRPVIGARGWPCYPGSGMKGAFRHACTTKAQSDRYCGKKTDNNDYNPGILRFHGGYPIDDSWQDGLVDIVHPQQSKQVGTEGEGKGSAFAMISLYQPTLRFGISSTVDLEQAEWDEIWKIWKKAIQKGIGGRVSAGYGQTNIRGANPPIYRCQLEGRGQASKLLDGKGEFRPNIFRAALRGHALRIFSGLTDANSAKRLVGNLFGSIEGSGSEGLLSLNFIAEAEDIILDTFANIPTYEVVGEINWNLTRTLESDEHRLALKKLLTGLTHFAMIFGGFGKSWRRIDHHQFFKDYYERDNKRILIGCHWRWHENLNLQRDRYWHLSKLDQIEPRIRKFRETALAWIELQGLEQKNPTLWRESWHPDNVQVWARIAENEDDSIAIKWFHGSYSNTKTIKKSKLTGKMGEVGRMWHRMYPVITFQKNEADPSKPEVIRQPKFIEILTIFPDVKITECKPFLQFLQEEDDGSSLLSMLDR
jgi:CRISPR-associated protein Cmr6